MFFASWGFAFPEKIAIVAGSTASPHLMVVIRLALGMAGVAGFEPAHDGIKTRCLTTWLHPTSLELSRAIVMPALSTVNDAEHQ